MSSPVMDNNSNSANPAILSPTENSATDNSTEFANCADEFVSCEEDNNNIPTSSSSSAEPVVPDQAGEEEEGQQKDCQIPTNHVHIGMVNPLTTMLDLTAGDFLELTTKTGKIIGELLQLNSKTGILLLREQKNGEKANLHFVNISNLKTFNKIASSALNYRPPRLPFNSYQAANDRLARAEHRKEKLWVNSELIDQTAMRTFVELKRIFEDVSWDSTKIIVLKCVSIGHPYDETAIRALDSNWSSENTAIRIKKILKRQMSPQSTTNSSTSMANASFDSGENNSIRSSSESKMASAIATLVTATAIDCIGVDGKS